MTIAIDRPLSDAELLRDLATERREDALGALVERHGPAVYAAARRQAGDVGLAEDVAQAAFIVLLRRAGSLRRPDLLPGWLMNVTRNCALTARRAARRRAAHEAAVPPATDAAAGPPEAAERAELLSHLDRVLAGLPDVDRAIVTMAYLQSQAVEQIGTALGMNGPAVRKRLARAIDKMRRGFGRAGVSVSSMVVVAQMQRLPAPPPPGALTAKALLAAHAGGGSAAGAIALAVGRRAAWKLLAVTGACLALGAAVAVTVVMVERKRGLHTAVVTSPRPAAVATVAAAVGVQSGPATDVYHSDFARGAVGWSARHTAATPNGHIPYLGPLTSTSVRLPIAGLPPHRFLRVQAELLIMGSWDGTGHVSAARMLNGPCVVTFGLGDRPPVVRSTIADQLDNGYAYAAMIQTYPSVAPDYPRVMGTGAAAVRSLGVVESLDGGRFKYPADCRFHLDVTLPHTADTVTIRWAASGLILDQKSWGLADVKVEAVPATPVPTRDQLDQWWRAAIAPDPVPARAAFLKLLAGDDATVAYLLQRPEPPPFNADDVAARLQELDGPDPFEAERDLVAMGPGVEALLSTVPEPSDVLGTRAAKSLVAIYEATELRPIESPALRAAAVKARLLAQIASPAARKGLADWFAAGPEWQPDLARAFESVYRLPHGQQVKYIPTPDPAARSDYLRRRAQVFRLAPCHSQTLFQMPPADGPFTPIAFTVVEETPDLYAPLWADDRLQTGDGSAGPADALQQVVHYLSNANIGSKAWVHVVIPKALRATELPGDWLVRFHATQRQMMNELAAALSVQLGRPVAIALDPPATVVTSVLTSDPARPTTQPALATARQIDLYTDPADRARPAVRVTTEEPWELAGKLQYMYGRTIQFQRPGDRVPLAVSIHPGAWRKLSTDEAADPENATFIDGVLDHLAEQLGMRRTNQLVVRPVYRINVGP